MDLSCVQGMDGNSHLTFFVEFEAHTTSCFRRHGHIINPLCSILFKRLIIDFKVLNGVIKLVLER